MEEPNYWTRWAKRRLSRRRVLKGAAGLGAGLAAASVVGCGGGEEGPAGTAGPTSTPGGDGTAAATGTPAALEPAKTRGGMIRWFGSDAVPLDTLDPHQSQLGPLYNMQGAVFSKVLKYEDEYEGVIGTDLAETVPEVVDNTTYVIKIRPNVFFHDTEGIRKRFPEVAGRQLTAEDVRYSIDRQRNKESPKSALFYRQFQWETVDKIEVGPDPLQLTITTKGPTAPFKHYLADTYSTIVPKELVDEAGDDMNSADKMVGTGPFMLDKFLALQMVRCVRNPNWFAKDDLADKGLPDRPIVDGYEALWRPEDQLAIQAAFSTKQVDTTEFLDKSVMESVTRELGATFDRKPESGGVTSRLLINDSPAAESPFKDLRLRQAINIALDRSRVGQLVHRGVYNIGSPVAQAIAKWALPLDELTKRPGYRFRPDEREADVAEAKRLWEAGGGASVGTVECLYAGVPDIIRNAFPQFAKMAADTLGLELKGRLDATGYTEIAQAALQKRLIFALTFDNGFNDLDDYVYAYFHSNGPKNSFMLADPQLDQMLEGQRAEFDEARRQQLGYEIQRYLLDNVLAKIDWTCGIGLWAQWPYRRNRKVQPWFGESFLLANEWLDSTHPTFEGRPA
ncbi:MAG TPA: ABC transporter substrate-binding protein [Dehalococcoidia bacterium]|nr:ABC transporter substrate-binding protein [Dehalococcoidia bacterium]